MLTKLSVISAILFTSTLMANEPLDLSAPEDKAKTERYWVVSKTSQPEYPQSAIRNKQSGCVEFTFVINSQGQPEQLTVSKSFPEGVFDRAAFRAMRNFRWQATPENSAQQPVKTAFQMDFTRRGSENFREARLACSVPKSRQ